MKILHGEETECVVHTRRVLEVKESEPLHWHNGIEIIYVENGSIRLAIRKRSFDMKEGDFALIKSCDHHRYHDGYTSTAQNKTIIRTYKFPLSVISAVSKFKQECSFIAEKGIIESKNLTSFLFSAMTGIEFEKQNPCEFSEPLIDIYIIQLYLSLQKTYIKKEDLGTTLSADYEGIFPDYNYSYENIALGDKTMGKLQKLLDYMEHNYIDSELSLSSLSTVSGLSKCYISELFPIVLGINFKQHLNTLRINHALRILALTNVTISEAAYESGFETIRTFNSVFKKLKGVTPSEYLNGLKEKGMSGIHIGFKNLRATTPDVLKMVFGGSARIKIAADPENKKRNVFELSANAKNKAWVSFNINMLFKAGMTYKVEFDLYPLPDVNGNTYQYNTFGVNFFYAEQTLSNHTKTVSEDFSGSAETTAEFAAGNIPEAVSHCNYNMELSESEGWTRVECEQHVSENYIPGLYDKFSIFSNPKNNVGVNFLLDNISCYRI